MKMPPSLCWHVFGLDVLSAHLGMGVGISLIVMTFALGLMLYLWAKNFRNCNVDIVPRSCFSSLMASNSIPKKVSFSVSCVWRRGVRVVPPCLRAAAAFGMNLLSPSVGRLYVVTMWGVEVGPGSPFVWKDRVSIDGQDSTWKVTRSLGQIEQGGQWTSIRVRKSVWIICQLSLREYGVTFAYHILNCP